jgi:protein-disulfide isomerase
MTRTPFQVETGRLVEPVNRDDHVRGPGSAPVTLVEYGDYECPYCGRAYPVAEALLAERPTLVRLVFRHFPLTDLHPRAEIAAELAEAAAMVGQFWRAHAWLYTHQGQFDAEHLRGLAVEIDPSGGVERELERRAYSDRIHRDFLSGVRSGVNGTPSFFINGVRYDGDYSLPALSQAVDAAAQAAQPS